jgi:hypothetical protein
MSDPIETLEGLPPESPPREVVLSSLRLFRYRAFTAVLVVVVAVLGLAFVANTVGRSQVDREARTILENDRVEFRPASGTALIGSVQVTVTEVAISPAGNAARVVFVDVGTPEPAVEIDVSAVRQGSATLGANISIQSLGRHEGRTGTAVWLPLDPTMDPFGADIEIIVLPIPQSILDEGGELTSDDGHTGVVTIERPFAP